MQNIKVVFDKPPLGFKINEIQPGSRFYKDNNKLKISAVKIGGYADRLGLKKNDILMKVNKKDLTSLRLKQGHKLIKNVSYPAEFILRRFSDAEIQVASSSSLPKTPPEVIVIDDSDSDSDIVMEKEQAFLDFAESLSVKRLQQLAIDYHCTAATTQQSRNKLLGQHQQH